MEAKSDQTFGQRRGPEDRSSTWEASYVNGPTAGWYIDPHNGAQQRWWDGQMWTTHTAPSPLGIPTDHNPARPGASFDDNPPSDLASEPRYPATIPAVIGAFFLLLAYTGGPYELYVVARWAVTAMAIRVASLAVSQKRTAWVVVFTAIALLFNPLFPVLATREFWIPLDVAGLILFWVAGVKLRSFTPAPQEARQHFSDPSSGSRPAPSASVKSIPRSSHVAGWYVEPGTPHLLRCWDGHTWTSHTKSKEIPTPHSNPLAVTGFGLGIGSVFLFSVPVLGLVLSLAAIVVSAMGIPQRPGTAKRFRVFAILGVILGSVYSVMALIFLVRGS